MLTGNIHNNTSLWIFTGGNSLIQSLYAEGPTLPRGSSLGVLVQSIYPIKVQIG
jgi:hypothetical protein